MRERRGDRLTSDEATVFSGEVWTGARAQALGLVDGLGTLRGVLGERYPDARISPVFTTRFLVTAALGRMSSDREATVPAMLRALEDRAAWARVGL